MQKPILSIVALMGTLSLAACASSPPSAPAKPEFHFSSRAPFNLRAASLQIEPAYVPPGSSDHVEQNYDFTPTDLATAWARDRLSLTSTSGKLTLHIQEASVIETPLETSKGIRGRFTNDQNRQLTARLTVELLLQDAPGIVPSRATATATASRTFSEKEVGDLERPGYLLLMEDLSRNFDAALSPQVATYIASH